MAAAIPPRSAPEPAIALPPRPTLRSLVEELLDDDELRGCLHAHGRIGERFLRLGFERIEFEGQPYDQLSIDDLYGDYPTENCINALLARGPQPDPTPDQLYFILIDPPGDGALGFREIRAIPPLRTHAVTPALALVGGSLGGAGFRDGPAEVARFHLPLGLAIDPRGEIVVADAENRAIRRIDPVTGEVTTMVEIPQFDRVEIAGIDQPVERQNLYEPVALAFDPQGRLHALDALKGEIWRIEPGRAVRVYQSPAGAFNTAADLSGPRAMVFDRDGTLLIADSGNHRIVRLDLSSGALAPVAGSFQNSGYRDGTRPLFDLPEGLALDPAGALYISEFGNNVIRKLDLATGKVTTVAGRRGAGGHADGRGKSARFDAPSSLVFQDGQLLVAESHGLVLRRIDLASGRVTTLAGKYARAGAADGVGSAARLAHHESSALGEMPFGMAMAGGMLYLADSGNHVVRRIVATSGAVSTLAGRAVDDAMPRPRALAFAGKSLYATAGQALYRLDPTGARLVAGHPSAMGHRDGVGRRARFRGPLALAGLSDGRLVVGEINGQVRLVDPKSGRVETITNLERILYAIAVDAADHIYQASLFEIARMSPDGARTVVIARDPAEHPDAIIVPGLHEPTALAVDGDRLYLLDAHTIYSGTPGTLTTLRAVDLATRTVASLATWLSPRARGNPSPGLTVAADHTLWLTHPSGAITRFDPSTGRELSVMAEPPSTRGVSVGDSPHVNRPAMPIVAPDSHLLFIDEGAVLELR